MILIIQAVVSEDFFLVSGNMENLEKPGIFFETTQKIFFHKEFSDGCMI